ncbi:MAG: hypothetical protein GTO17_01510 [Candidatus Aminicenantes bacterium]|nr:hypothetical protein [Candidatus Aminicenantes bacterium]
MQKIEKWRLEEFALVLKHLAELLSKGNNRDWATVFFHFHQEAQLIIAAQEFDLEQFKRLIINIKNCYSSRSSFMSLLSRHENEKDKIELNQELFKARTRLLKIMTELEGRSIEYIS